MLGLRDAIREIENRWPGAWDGEDDDPVFVFSAGWRSGSTLLQRLVISSEIAFIWGEPYADCDYLRYLADSLQAFKPGYPADEVFANPMHATANLNQFIANLYPHPSDLIEAHRQFFQRLFAAPARANGFGRWGIKEVRLSIQYAEYLRHLFRGAQFLFLIRNPYDAYRSYRCRPRWYDRWPDRPVFTARAYGEHWHRLAQGFIDGAARVGGLVVQYEDLYPDSGAIDDISDYLSLPLRKDVLKEVVSGRSGDLKSIPWMERRVLAKKVEPLSSRLGY